MSGPLLRADGPEADPALKRTREQVKMLDELYKNAVVSITNKYDGPPAIKVAKEVFAAMEKSGWHKAKLVDASGSPQNEANLPQTDFEKRAAVAIRAGKPYFEEIEGYWTGTQTLRRDGRAGRDQEMREVPRCERGRPARVHPIRHPSQVSPPIPINGRAASNASIGARPCS